MRFRHTRVKKNNKMGVWEMREKEQWERFWQDLEKLVGGLATTNTGTTSR